MAEVLPTLPGNWKGRYPFRTGTTSFIYPAGYTENVDRLGPHLDEIELLMFESHPASRPTAHMVAALTRLGAAHTIRYNVHLPTDLDLTDPDDTLRYRACGILKEFITTLMPLDPTVFVLHLAPPPQDGRDATGPVWQKRAAAVLEDVLRTGLPGRRLALENLFFPFNWLEPLIERFDLSVCLDTGHLALQSGDLEAFLDRYGSRIAILHLHGLRKGKDHAPSSGLTAQYVQVLGTWLQQFNGSVSLEVFSFDDLRVSLCDLDQLMT